MFDIFSVTLYTLLCYLWVFVWHVWHNSSYFVDIIVLFMCIRSTSLTWNKANILVIVLFTVHCLHEIKYNKTQIKTIYLFMFLFVPLHGVQVVTGKAAEGTYKGFSCMGLPFHDPYMVLHWRQAHFLTPPIITITGSSDNCSFSFFTGEAGGGMLVFSLTSISDAGGGGVVSIGVVLPFSWHRRLGRSPGPTSSTASLNNSHPSMTVACPCAASLWPAATFLTVTNKKEIQFDMFDTYMHLILEILVLIFYGVWHVWHRVQYSTVPVNIFLFISCPFLKILSTSWSSSVLSSSSSELLTIITRQPPYLSHTTIWCPLTRHPQPTMLLY